MVDLMKSSPSAQTKTKLKTSGQEETLKGFLLYFWGKGWARDTGAGTVFCWEA